MADGRLGPELEHPTPAHAAQLDVDLGGRDLRFRRDVIDYPAPVHAGRVLQSLLLKSTRLTLKDTSSCILAFFFGRTRVKGTPEDPDGNG